MPKFRVYKAKDATVHFTGVVEAEHIAEAADFVADTPDAVAWKQLPDVFLHEGEQLFTDMTEPLVGEEEEPVTHVLRLTTAEHSTVLAALRMWIDNLMRGPDYFNNGLIEIATNGGEHDMLHPEAIDELCERINV